MENNPVKQRVITLTEQWRQKVAEMPDARMFCWVGASSVDYKMIQGFVMYHMSEESTIDDIFFCFKHPFEDGGFSAYGNKIIQDAGAYIKMYNADSELIETTGVVDWHPSGKDKKETDASYFATNINLLAEKLRVRDKDQYLVIAIFPQSISDFSEYTQWLSQVIRSGISTKVRLMVYDNYDYKAFDGFERQFPLLFHKIHTDLNMTGAMHQVLEDSKSGKKDKQERDAVSFQQLVIKITEAIGQNDKGKINNYLKQSQDLAREYNWPHMEAMVYYFIHSWYVINKRQTQAHEALDTAIKKSDEAFDKKILINEDVKYYYRIAKGNLYFMNKKFNEAAEVYKTCLDLNRNGIDRQLLLGIYQMLGNSLKHLGDRKSAWLVFLEGWDMIKAEQEEAIRSNKFIHYYAKEMAEVCDNGENARHYHELFCSYWGKSWLINIKEDSTTILAKRELTPM